MWHTAEGTRTVAGAEARLICETVGELVDAIRAEKIYDSNVELDIVLFDQLTWQQQMVMLSQVLKPLLDSSVPPPPLTALREATVAAIYAQMRVGVEFEIDMEQTSKYGEEGDTDRRREIIQAIKEHGSEGSWPDPECTVMETWELAICEVQGWMLPDEDWQMDGLTLDLPPDKSREFKQTLGIRDDYFTDVPPDATNQQARTAWADILELTRGQRPNEAVFD